MTTPLCRLLVLSLYNDDSIYKILNVRTFDNTAFMVGSKFRYPLTYLEHQLDDRC